MSNDLYAATCPALPPEMAAYGFPGAGGYCHVCGCTLYFPQDVRSGECRSCAVDWVTTSVIYLVARRRK
jgi:hypothetical protein